VERFYRIGTMIVMKFRSSGDSKSNRVENKLRTISLSRRQIDLKRVVIGNFRVNKKGSSSVCSSLINSIANTS